MISARSLRRRSNGNSQGLFFLLLMVFGLSACGIFGDKGPRKTTIDLSDDVEKEKEVKPKVDTVILRDVTDTSLPPIKEKAEKESKNEFKDAYDVALLFPFNAVRYQNINSQVDPKGKRFIHFYGGVRMAVDDLINEGIRINLSTYDTEESISKVTSLLEFQSVKNADLILGPYRPEAVTLAAKTSSDNSIPLVSPWVPAFDLPETNPYFIHMTPGLAAHAEAIYKHVEGYYPDAEIFLVGRNLANESMRQEIFKEAFMRTARHPDSLKMLTVEDNTSDLQNTDMLSIMEDQRRAVFVLPYYSRSEEAFINSMLRKLHAEKLTKEVIVYGMPQWLNFRDLNYDYLESLQAHVSTISHNDNTHPKYSNFKSRFLNRYGIVPDPAAFQGYDMMFYFGTLLDEKGTGFIDELDADLTRPISLGIDIQPRYRNPLLDRDPDEEPIYLENKGIQILKFEDFDFRRTN